jgi:predicted transcriptional regulator
MRVAAKNNLGAIMAQRFKIMQGLATFVASSSEKAGEVYTYSQVMANKSVADNGIWDGNLLNGSLAETVSAILKGTDDSIPRV